MGDGYLVSWVHPDFIELVEKGIRVNATECIRWLDKTDTLFNELWRCAEVYRDS